MSPVLLLIAAVAAATPEAPFNPFDALALESAVERDRYLDCVALVDADTERGRAAAEKWTAEGGGVAAHHCRAVADLASGFPRLAAIRLMQIVERADAGDILTRARFLEQAALAFMEAEAPEHALEALNEARRLAPNSGELSLTAGVVYAANEMWQATVDAVTAAEEQGFRSPAAFVARGRAHMALAKNLRAAEDVVAALKMDPFDLDALVLRGELQQLGVEIDANYQRAPAAPR